MTEFIEENLRMKFPDRVTAERFDVQASNGLSYCMKTADFIARVPEEFIALIGLGNPNHPNAPRVKKEDYLSKNLHRAV